MAGGYEAGKGYGVDREGGRVDGELAKCPVCGGEAFEVFFGDKIQRWRCMGCELVFTFQVYVYQNGELARVRTFDGCRKAVRQANEVQAVRG